MAVQTSLKPASSVAELGMRAQAALLPHALAAFGVCLPIFMWAASRAADVVWLSLLCGLFGLGWAAFYAVLRWLRTDAAGDLAVRARIQVLGGLIWASVIAAVTVFAHFAGPPREVLLLLSLGAALVCVVFTATWLPSLLIVAPATLAAPLIALFQQPGDLPTARLGLAAASLALALALLVNRILRTQYALAVEREALLAERGEQADAARRFARVKADLVDTLSDELRDGLTGVSHVLAAAARGRAAPTRQQIGVALDAVNELLAIVGAPADEAPGRRLRILTLEADALAAATLRATLEQLGHQVVHTAQPARAAELARICDLDLAICGEAGGVVALRALPGQAGEIPVVALVGGEPSDAEAVLDAGADALLRRPVAATAAARSLAEALSARAPGAALAVA